MERDRLRSAKGRELRAPYFEANSWYALLPIETCAPARERNLAKRVGASMIDSGQEFV